VTGRVPETLALTFPSHQSRPVTGMLELELAAAISPHITRPERVTGVLTAVFSTIGGNPADHAQVQRLTCGAREWLLQQAAGLFWSETGWFQSQCSTCGAHFDIPATLHNAPRKSAGEAFPVVTVDTSLGTRTFEAPNGLHEEALARESTADATRTLLARCALGATALQDANAFTRSDIARIEASLENACPDVADEIATTCPSCQALTTVRLDPLTFAFPNAQALVGEAHLLAAAYHWSEDAILELPSRRRRAYAMLIRAEQATGRDVR
jgi:hypothetical protein